MTTRAEPPLAAQDTGQYDLVLVDQSHDAHVAARARAEERLTEELNQGGRLRRFVSGLWKGNIAKDYYRQKYTKAAEREIVAAQDILVHESTDEQARSDAMLATIQRFQSDYEEMVRTEAGESRQEVVSDTEIADSLKGVIRDFAEGRIDEANLIEERSRILQAYQEHHGHALVGEGVVQIDNMVAIARSVKGAVEHGESLDAIIDGMKVVTGESRAGVRTEIEYSRAEQVIEKLRRSKAGTLLGSEATIAAATIALSVARFGSKRAVGAAAMTIAPGVGAGLLAGLREKKRVKEDWVQHSREMAQGKQFDSDTASRRQEMEEARYETVAAGDLIRELGIHLEEGALDTDDALRAALDQLSAITAREKYSDEKSVDLISYSSAAEVETERFNLTLRRAELKVALRTILEDDDTRQRLGIDSDVDIDEIIQDRSEAFIDQFETDIDAKDAVFRKLRRRRVATAAAVGAAAGLTFGVASQEIGASLSSTREGLVEQLWDHDSKLHDGVQHDTLLNGIAGGDSETISTASTGYQHDTFGSRGSYDYSSEMNVQDNGDGTLTVMAADGSVVADHLPMRESGRLTEEGIATLRDKGFHVEDLSFKQTLTEHETKTVTLNEYLEYHQADTTQVTRDLWYDNDTPAPVFDQNELGLHWGGEQGKGITGNGDIQFSVASMTADGSYHSSEEAAWQQAAQNGNLKLAISPSANSQDHPFLINVRPNGTIDIPQDHPAAQFFSTEDGQAVFNGKYAEVVQMTGTDENGVEHIRPLATHVGTDNVNQLTDVIVTKHTEFQPRYEITAPPQTEQVATFTEMAPVIPAVRRRSLETLESARLYYSGYTSRAELERSLGDLARYGSPRLRDDPDTDLNTGEELAWFERSLRKRQGGYVDDLQRRIGSSPEMSAITDELESIVTIPVKANGVAEPDTIYDLLRVYANQDPEALKKNLMLLHVNWAKRAEADPTEQARIQKTLSEIERAKRDFPALKIATLESQWSDEELEDGVIGKVGGRMNDAALLMLHQAIKEGRMDSSHEVQIIRNDADAKGIHKNYLESYQKAFRDNQETDVYTGTTRFDNRRATDLPGMVMGQQFAQSIDILESARGGKVHTGGANFGVRASTLAAVAPVLSLNSGGVGSDDVVIGRTINAARSRNPGYLTDRPLIDRVFKRSSSPYYSGASPLRRTKRKVAKRVTGAQIDTDSQRSEEVYLLGGYFHTTWDKGFDDGGHAERGRGLSDPALVKRRKELADDIDEQINVLEKDMQHTIGIVGGSGNPAVRTALEMIFGGIKDGPGYLLSGKTLRITPAGRTYLKNRFERDSWGRFDQYGRRLGRQLYGELGSRSRRTKPSAPLLSVA